MSVLKVYLNWATSVLENNETSKLVTVEDISKGKVLCQLIDAFQTSPQGNGARLMDELPETSGPDSYLEKVLDHLQSRNMKFNFAVSDILKGDIKSILDLLWRLILNYCIHDNGSDFAQHNSVSAGRKQLQSWCQQIIPEMNLDTRCNLVKSLCSTDYFFMLLEAIPGIKIPASDQPSKALHLEFLLENIESQLGIKKDILSVSELLNGTIDEQILMIYLALLKWKVNNRFYYSKVSPRKQLNYLSPHKLTSSPNTESRNYCFPTSELTPKLHLFRNTSDKNTFQSKNSPNFRNLFSSTTKHTLSSNANESVLKTISDIPPRLSYGKRSKCFDTSTVVKESPATTVSIYPATVAKQILSTASEDSNYTLSTAVNNDFSADANYTLPTTANNTLSTVAKSKSTINNTTNSSTSLNISPSAINNHILSTNVKNVPFTSINISPSTMARQTSSTNINNVSFTSVNISPSKIANKIQTSAVDDTALAINNKIIPTAHDIYPSIVTSKMSTSIINTTCTTVNSSSSSTISSLLSPSSITKQTMVSTLVLPVLTPSSKREQLVLSNIPKSISPPSASPLLTTTASLITMTDISEMPTKIESGPTVTCSSIQENLWPKTQLCRKNVLNSPTNSFDISLNSGREVAQHPKTIDKITTLSSPYFLSCSTLQLSKKPVMDVCNNRQTEKCSEKYLPSYSPGFENNRKQSPLHCQYIDNTINVLKQTSSIRKNDSMAVDSAQSISPTVMSPVIGASVKDTSSKDNGIYTYKKVFLVQNTELPAQVSQVASPLLSFGSHPFNRISNFSSLSENQILLSNSGVEQDNSCIVQESLRDKLVSPPPPLTPPPSLPSSPSQYLPTYLPLKISSKASDISQTFPHCQDDGEIANSFYLAPYITLNHRNSIKDDTAKEKFGQSICLDQALSSGSHDRCDDVPENQDGEVITEELNFQDGLSKQRPLVLTSEKIEFLCEEIGKLKEKVNAMETGRTSLNNFNSSFEDITQSVQVPRNSPTGDCQLATTSNFNNMDFNLNTARFQEQNNNLPSLITSLENSKHQQVVIDGKNLTEQQIKLEQSFLSAENTLQESNNIHCPNKSNSPSFSSNISPFRRGHLWKPWTRTNHSKTIETAEDSNFELENNNAEVSNCSSCSTDLPISLVNKINQQTRATSPLIENISPKRTKCSNGTIPLPVTSPNITNVARDSEHLVMKATKMYSLSREDEQSTYCCTLCRINSKSPAPVYTNSKSNTNVADDELNANDKHFKETFLKVISSSANNQEFQNLLEKYSSFEENVSDRIYLILKQLKHENENLKENVELEKIESHNLRMQVGRMEKLKKADVEKTEQESQTKIECAEVIYLQQENIALKEKLEIVEEESSELKEDVMELKDYQKGVEKVLIELQEQVLKTEYDKQVLSDELTLLWRQRKALKPNNVDLDQSFKSDGYYQSRSQSNIDEATFSNPYLIENHKTIIPTTSSPTGQTLSNFPFHLSPVVDGQHRDITCPDTPRLYRTMSYLSQVDRNDSNKSDMYFPQSIWRSKEKLADNSTSNFENKLGNKDKNGNASNMIKDCNQNKHQLGQQNKYQRLYWSDQYLDRLVSNSEISNIEEKHNLFGHSSFQSRHNYSSIEEPSRTSSRQRINNVTFNLSNQTENRSLKQGSTLKGILKNVKSTSDNLNVVQSLSKSYFTNSPRKVRSVPSSPQKFSHHTSAEDLAQNSDMEEFLKPLNSLESMKSPFGIGRRWNSHDSLISSASKWSLNKRTPTPVPPLLQEDGILDITENSTKKGADFNCISVNKTLSDDPYFEWRLKRKSPDIKPLFGNPEHPRWVHTPYNFFLANTKPASDSLTATTSIFSPSKIYNRCKNVLSSRDSKDTANMSETNNSAMEFSRTPTTANQFVNLTNTTKAQEFSNVFSPEQLEYSPNTDQEHNTIVRNLCSVFESSDLSFDGSEPGSAKKIRSWYDLDRNSPTKLTKEQRQYADRLIEKYTRLPSEKFITPTS